MNTHYYFSWFNHCLPDRLAGWLHEDIQDRQSLVMISAELSNCEGEQIDFADIPEWTWLNQAKLIFDESYFIDYRMQKEEARRVLQHASVVFLCGGDPVQQNELVAEYELADVIKNSAAVILGASAGALNMAAKWVTSKQAGQQVDIDSVYDGLGLEPFAYESHSKRGYASFVQGYLFPLAEQMDVYAAEQESAIRVQGGKISILGPVYLISRSSIQKCGC
ncbi:Type 1 glutamine amidotransferase-like domain-containing protein [Paenibacillus sp. FSL K6-1096]|uniref:Type 1 glutamine amidotransferase-like domain-containing protein n=1 Tax=Paenibacillus sp. FSL K6-1096 TaxID=2921460 RepID=UPI0030EB975B